MRPSRRAFVVGAAFAPIATSEVRSSTAEVTDICALWLAVHSETERLQAEWGRAEHDLVSKFDWRRLNDEQRGRHPSARLLDDIDERLDELGDQRDTVTAMLAPSLACLVLTHPRLNVMMLPLGAALSVRHCVPSNTGELVCMG